MNPIHPMELLQQLYEASQSGAFAMACDGASKRNNAHILESKGFAEWRGTSWGSSFYSITEAGRAALSRHRLSGEG